MEALEICMIMGKHGSLVSYHVRKNDIVGNTLAGSPRLRNRAHVMSETAEFNDNQQRKIFVRVESDHECD
jgi:hypothetical protein